MMRALGLDFSEHNGLYTIKPNPPKPVTFVIQRLSYVGYGSLQLTKDAAINTNSVSVLASPLKGAYHYVASYMDWKKQADYFITLMNNKFDFWAWDIEKTNNTNVSVFRDGIIPALEYLYNTTKNPGLLYINPDIWATWLVPIQNKLIEFFARKDISVGLWIAHYWNTPNPEGNLNYFTIGGCSNMPKNWTMWQYAADASAPYGHEYGVASETIDLNVFNGDVTALTTWVKPSVVPPVVIPPVVIPPVVVPPTEGSYMNILPVKYVSQIITGALSHTNDCGAASSLMLLRTYNLANSVTVDQFYDSIYPSGDSALSVGDMQTKMASYGLKNTWKVGTIIENVFGFLKDKKPLLALIHYAPLVDAKVTQKTGFRGAHFVVITGIDLENIYIDDPYRDDGKVNVAVPISVFEQAWRECSLDGNPNNGCIIPNLPIQDLSTTIPPTNGTTYVVNVNVLNVRSSPNSSSSANLIGTVTKGTEVVITTVASGWAFFSFLPQFPSGGWLYLSYLVKK
jgi:GH25 family lysozyme M1 (1,4-beta-N-acetylmuramidase)